ncbi:unnamed protein product [Caenorhabditis brenneri]
MKSKIQLIDMPEDSMRHILERCDFVSIQRLRKTCHTFRNFIDETKPSQLNDLDISGHHGRVSLEFSENADDKLYPASTKVQLDYNDLGDGNTMITWHFMDGKRDKIIENSNNLDVFSRDFGTVLGCTQSKWNRISTWCHEDVLKIVREHLLSLTSPSKVHTLSISSHECQSHVVEFLQSFCPDALNRLHFTSPYEKWNMSEMVKLEQWKKAKELNMILVIASAEIESYFHFETAYILFGNVMVDDLCKLKELFLNTPSITKHFKLEGFNSLNKDILATTLGEPYISEDPDSSYWYFQRLDNYVLCMDFSENSSCFDFSIVTKANVPRDALIL